MNILGIPPAPCLPRLSSFVTLKVTTLVAQTVKRLPTMRETRVRSLGREDPLEKEMAARSSTLAWKIPWTEEAGGLQSMGPQRVGHDRATSFSLSLSCNEKNHQQYIFKLSSLLTNSKG